MIKGWISFLESSNIDFKELEGLIEKEIEYLNLINDIVQRYEDQCEFSYEFDRNLLFYAGATPRSSTMISTTLDEHISFVLQYINGEICFRKLDYFYNEIYKKILNSPTGYIRYSMNIKGGSEIDNISNMIIDEIRSQYPFTRIDLPIRTPNHIYLYLEANTKNFRS